ncbi:MAG: hypothetical protein ACYDAE_00295 [Steroidobacteraceae bacterium]
MPPFANLFRLRKRFSHHSPEEGIKMKKSDLPVCKPSPTYVTREELDALARVVGVALAGAELARNRAGFPDGTIAHHLARAVGEDAADRVMLKKLVKAFDAYIGAHHAAERRRTIDRGSAYHRV